MNIGDSFRIVYYHIINNNKPPFYPKRPLNTNTFKNHINYFKKRYDIICLNDAIQKINDGGSLKNKIAITFDDGFNECYSIIAPILLENNITASFFLIDDCIDNNSLMWRNKLEYISNSTGTDILKKIMAEISKDYNINPPLKNENIMKWSDRCWSMKQKDILSDIIWESAKLEPLDDFLSKHKPYMSHEQVEDLISDGFHIGSHTMSHPNCSKLNYEELTNEIVKSQKNLSSKFHINVDMTAYPFGKRPPFELECELINKNPRIKSLLGIKHTFSNFNNPFVWERDNMEFNYPQSLIRFHLLPLIRKKIKI